MMKRSILSALFAFSASIASAQDNGSSHMALLANFRTHESNVTSSIKYSAIWGYTDTGTHREYAVLGCYLGTSIVDITDADRGVVTETGFIDGPASIWREMKCAGHYAYVVSEGTTQPNQGLQIIDMIDPAHPRLVRADSLIIHRSHSISNEGHYLYCNGSDIGMAVLDIADPEHPVLVGTLATPYVHDSYVRGDTIFAAHIQGEGLGIYDASHKAFISEIQRIHYPGAGTHNAWTSEDRQYVFTTDEVGATRHDVKVWDIRDLNQISKVAEFAFDSNNIAHNIFVRGRYATVAHYTAGVCVWEVSDPTLPVLVSYYDTYPDVSGGYAGAWGTYPYFPSGKIITSDMQTGLYVTKLVAPAAGRVDGKILDPRGPQAAGIPVQVRSSRGVTAVTVTDDSGRFRIGIPDTGRVVVSGGRVDDAGFSVDTILVDGTTIHLSIIEELGVGEALTNPILVSFSSSPNPADVLASIDYVTRSHTHVRVLLSDLLGRSVATLANGTVESGDHHLTAATSALPTGSYRISVEAAGGMLTKAIVVVH